MPEKKIKQFGRREESDDDDDDGDAATIYVLNIKQYTKPIKMIQRNVLTQCSRNLYAIQFHSTPAATTELDLHKVQQYRAKRIDNRHIVGCCVW